MQIMFIINRDTSTLLYLSLSHPLCVLPSLQLLLPSITAWYSLQQWLIMSEEEITDLKPWIIPWSVCCCAAFGIFVYRLAPDQRETQSPAAHQPRSAKACRSRVRLSGVWYHRTACEVPPVPVLICCKAWSLRTARRGIFEECRTLLLQQSLS